ncbi:hypothetical protein EJ05DRAFT_271366 [Pseudovirgaria hyperparasitica]|uniref:DUF7703 domain-containing protein n=1 Tax=Pseudovirgaria hyperparasitica TaxID=470096 RepID=A0A6A6WDD9_9PEZI|nr:uncharacterized protein EJ05DRAFT_271366 [Pseudovirgaria hyperparasitica]KAF2760074.1 hypothetical protein EJ05DRAFT_271366 [Pseudovirgaria hyperparasitica]
MPDQLDSGNGSTKGYRGGNELINQAMMAFTAIAWANAIELTVLIFVVFKRYEGTYFWSLLLSTLSIVPYSIGAWIKQVYTPYRDSVPSLLPVAFLNISWLILIPGQSIVLWSRLHLIIHNRRQLRFILWLIIVNWFLFCIPTTVFTWGSNTHQGPFVTGYAVYEKIQMVAFSLQEIYISGIYVWEVRKVLAFVFERNSRKIMWELVAINVFIIALDIALLAVEFMNMYQVETTFKGMVYSIKLKLEFGVLSKLVKVVLERKDSHARIPSKTQESAMDLSQFPASPSETPQVLTTEQFTRSCIGSVSTRKGSIKHIEHMTRDFNLPAEWRRNHSDDLGHTGPLVLHEEDGLVDRPRMAKRESQMSDIALQYPGRLDSVPGATTT